MTTPAQKLHDYYTAWSDHDPDAIARFFTPDAIFEDLAFNATFEGHDGIRTFAQITFAGAPDFQITPDQIIVDGDHAAATWTMRGTHSGDMPGFPATNRPFEIQAASIIHRRATLITTMRDFWNPNALR